MISKRWFKLSLVKNIMYEWGYLFTPFSVFTEIIGFWPEVLEQIPWVQSMRFFVFLVLITLFIGIYRARPKTRFSYSVHNRDVKVDLLIGDIIEANTAFVVPINSEFDIELGGNVKVSHSVLASVLKTYFGNDTKSLKAKIKKELSSPQYKTSKLNGRYKLGTTVCIQTDDKSQTFYFLVNSHKVTPSRVQADEYSLSVSLAGLWSHISSFGAKEEIAIPLLGTGNGRLTTQRVEVYREIIRSFIASCSEKCHCSKLIVVVRDEDISKYDIDVDGLVDFLRNQTEYADLSLRLIKLPESPNASTATS